MSAPAIGCVVMASGEGKRFGGNKLLADFDGRPLIAYPLERLIAVRPPLSRIVVVTRSTGVARIAGSMGVQSVLHALPSRSDTICLGVQALRDAATDGCLFCVGDQPLLRRETVEGMIAAFARDRSRVVRAAFGDTPGNPVLFPAALLPELEALAPGETGATVMRRHRERMLFAQAASADELADVDAPEDIARLLERRRALR